MTAPDEGTAEAAAAEAPPRSGALDRAADKERQLLALPDGLGGGLMSSSRLAGTRPARGVLVERDFVVLPSDECGEVHAGVGVAERHAVLFEVPFDLEGATAAVLEGTR